MSGKAKVMISYASEDRDFARSLRDELAKFCDVWFDQDQIKVGDSLFEQINRGLGSSDFAVVILTPYYIAKKWTNNELAGFMALEDRTRKIILPVWMDITRDQVAQFSGILADRSAIKASDGMPAVVAQLQSVIEAAKRAVELATRPAAVDRLAAYGRDLHTKAQTQARLETTEGVNEVKAGAEALLTRLEVTLAQAQSDGLKFNIKRELGHLTAETRNRLMLSVSFRVHAINTLHNSPLRIGVFRLRDPFEEEPGPSLIDERKLDGWLDNGAVVWRENEREVYTNEDVVGVAFDLLLRALKHEAQE